jgi:hypothetical protein
MERIVYLDRSVLRTAIRRPAFEHEWIEFARSRPEAVKARLEAATIAITHRVILTGEDFPPTLGLIAMGATGTKAQTSSVSGSPRLAQTKLSAASNQPICRKSGDGI